ncbi:hypothetical protein DGI_2606 [Megalodesulfovibrio gigas DSM 1382 = ATCC 19364]|uniref:Uncharacterized protein n=1 Tax=Megalodesulfovibrio gigas (strain ATCC 19364 / DSM 1382 / NCIMB 9332 / VKM B-1759) TaxID=1121448 RepID=T2GEI9_MEGG1|nr:hypothetical protein DGI_2606 [Megalodesulfovibrio gigas DSM 1382 = ATCC 19364]
MFFHFRSICLVCQCITVLQHYETWLQPLNKTAQLWYQAQMTYQNMWQDVWLSCASDCRRGAREMYARAAGGGESYNGCSASGQPPARGTT